jgi:hypothetical protein
VRERRVNAIRRFRMYQAARQALLAGRNQQDGAPTSLAVQAWKVLAKLTRSHWWATGAVTPKTEVSQPAV